MNNIPYDSIASANIAVPASGQIVIPLNSAGVAKLEYCRQQGILCFIGLQLIDEATGKIQVLSDTTDFSLVLNTQTTVHGVISAYSGSHCAFYLIYNAGVVTVWSNAYMSLGSMAGIFWRGCLQFDGAALGDIPITSASVTIALGPVTFSGTIHAVVCQADTTAFMSNANTAWAALGTTQTYYAPPIASFTVQKLASGVIELTDTSYGIGVGLDHIDIAWGDNTPSTRIAAGGNAFHLYPTAGPYIITYTATSTEGAVTTITRSISMSAITKVSTANGAAAQPAVDLITIAGSGFGAGQGAGTAQVETATVHTGDNITTSGNALVTVTAAGMNNSPKMVSVALVQATDTTPTLIATKIRTALTADPDVSAFFTVGGSTANITLTAKTIAANDTTMNVGIAPDGTIVGLVAVPTSANTTAGVAPDSVLIGGVAATNIVWADTQITCKAGPATSLGGQDLVVSVIGTKLTVEKALFIWDPTNLKASASVPFLIPDHVWIDGIDGGLLGECSIMIDHQSKSLEDQTTGATIDTYVWVKGGTAKVILKQESPAIIAALLNGTYDAVNKVLNIFGGAANTVHSLVLKDAKLGFTYIRKAKLAQGQTSWVYNRDFGSFEFTFDILVPADPGTSMLAKVYAS